MVKINCPEELLPSPENHHVWILFQLPGEVEGEGDLDGAALNTRKAWWLDDPKGLSLLDPAELPGNDRENLKPRKVMEWTTQSFLSHCP